MAMSKSRLQLFELLKSSGSTFIHRVIADDTCLQMSTSQMVRALTNHKTMLFTMVGTTAADIAEYSAGDEG
jgi:hypothetical protein